MAKSKLIENTKLAEMIFDEGLDNTLMWRISPQDIKDPRIKDLALQYIILREKITKALDLNDFDI